LSILDLQTVFPPHDPPLEPCRSRRLESLPDPALLYPHLTGRLAVQMHIGRGQGQTAQRKILPGGRGISGLFFVAQESGNFQSFPLRSGHDKVLYPQQVRGYGQGRRPGKLKDTV